MNYIIRKKSLGHFFCYNGIHELYYKKKSLGHFKSNMLR